MRLINSEDVKALINGLDSLPWEEEVDELVDRIPTAFDLDRVVQELEDVKELNEPRINNKTLERDIKIYKLTMNFAIKIVKAGEADENKEDN
jgi:hypothetical protein